MTDWLRRAGRGRLADGTEVVWTVAEGERGRRWRWTLVGDGILWRGGLVELARQSALGRLELTTLHGLLTLHPEPDGVSIHGNVAGPAGVRPLAFEWQPTNGIGLEGDPFGSAILAGEGSGLLVDDRLGIRRGAITGIARLALDDRGVPRLFRAEEWPLEE